jgi:hypothetical protein
VTAITLGIQIQVLYNIGEIQLNPSSLTSSSSSTSLTSSCSARLSTVLGKINLVVSNHKNASIIFGFHNYMQEKGSSENHQVNNLKVVMDFARYLVPITYYKVKKRNNTLPFQDMWQNSLDIISDWTKIEMIIQEGNYKKI